MFGWWTLNGVSYCSRIWIDMTIFIRDYRTCLDVNAVLWTNSWIGDRTTLTTLEFWVWHALVIILIWVCLNILKINGIPIRLGLCSCRSWTLHHHICLMLAILRTIWRYWCLDPHGWIMLVKRLLTNSDIFNCTIIRTLILLLKLRLFGCVDVWMKRLNWTSTLSW